MNKNIKKVLTYAGFAALTAGSFALAFVPGLQTIGVIGTICGMSGLCTNITVDLTTKIENKYAPKKEEQTFTAEDYKSENHSKGEQLSIDFDENKQLSIDFENKSSSNSNNKELEK